MTQPTVVRLSGVESLVAAVPQMLGFVPTESLVIMCVTGPRRRVTFTMRVDLDGALLMLPDLMARAVNADADAVVAAIFTDAPGHLPFSDLAAVMAELGIVEVIDVLLARDQRVWSYLCSNTTCCPPEGKPIGGTDVTNLQAAFAMTGRNVLADRATIEAEVAAPAPGTTTLTAAAIVVDVADVARFADPRETLTDAEVVGWVNALAYIPTRDSVLHLLADDKDYREALHIVLGQLVRRVPTGHDADVCVVAAAAFYADGDGLRVRLLIERALRTNPDHSLASLLARTLDAGINPDEVRKCLRAL